LELTSALVAQAKPETMAQVVDIVRKELALSDDFALPSDETPYGLGAKHEDMVSFSPNLPCITFMQSVYSQ